MGCFKSYYKLGLPLNVDAVCVTYSNDIKKILICANACVVFLKKVKYQQSKI